MGHGFPIYDCPISLHQSAVPFRWLSLPRPQRPERCSVRARVCVWVPWLSLCLRCQELEALVLEAHRAGAKIRPIGSGISPNGLALCEGGMVNLGLMDRVLSVDTATGRVTVQAGARVEQVRVLHD